MLTRFLIYLFILIFTIVGGLVVGSSDYPPLKDDSAPTDSGQPPGDSKRPQYLDIDAITTEFRNSLLARNPENRINSHTLSLIKHGIPSYDELIIRRYMLSYDTKNRIPKWVMEYLTKDMFENDSDVKRSDKYKEDTAIQKKFRSTNADYNGSGYDRGHIAKVANHVSSQEMNDTTFNLTNIAPQDPKMNRYQMWRSLEDHVLNLTKQKYGKYKSVHLCSGPLFQLRELTKEQKESLFPESKGKKKGKLTKEQKESLFPESEGKKKGGQTVILYKTIGENHVGVPTHFFKVVLCELEENKFDMESYIIPNMSLDSIELNTSDDNIRDLKSMSPMERLSNFLVNKDEIESYASFNIFHKLKESKIRKIKTKEDSSEEYYNI